MEDNKTLHQQLLEAGVHFGHLKKKWNPKMLPYIFAEKNGIHIIDLNKTIEGLEEAAAGMKAIARSGKKIMFVATKKQSKEIVAEAAAKVNMPFVTERWLGGMLTNFQTIRKSVKKMLSIEKMLADGTMDSVTKKERLTLTRSKEKMEKVLGGISQMGRTPAALFIVDISHEHIALAEAKRLGITTFAMVDTNSDPSKVDYAVPSNDDATKSISIITNFLTAAIMEGLQERAQVKDGDDENSEDVAERARGLEITEEDNEGGRRGGRGRGRGAAAGGAGTNAGGPGRGPGGGTGRPGGGPGGSRPGGAGGPGGGPG
ncbi:MAG: 30S ribosomal protein S2, partial [Taibaiella sp.]|nr:30S ribosomal protein S2 [Taibaiella sp.]